MHPYRGEIRVMFRLIGREHCRKGLSAFMLVGALFIATISQATHILGGTMYYEHLGGSQYRIILELYRDCGPNNTLGIPFDDPVMLGIYDGNGNFLFQEDIVFNGESLMPVTLSNPCLTLPPELCESVAYYTTTLELPPNGTGYHISYQRCCRTPGIVNLMVPEDQGFTCTVRIPPFLANSSPQFNALPPVALCSGEPLEVDMSAWDSDGDQLSYALWTPYTGGTVNDPLPLAGPPPYQMTLWANGYGAVQPIDSDPLLALDPETGILTIRPTVMGSFSIGIKVSEFRNGQLIGSILRDMHMNVVACGTMVPATIHPQEEFCTGLTIAPSNQASHGQYWAWNFGDPATLGDTSSGQYPQWTYAISGSYPVTLITNPGFSCADTSVVTFEVRPPIDVAISGVTELCPFQEITLVATGSFSASAEVLWDVESAGMYSGTQASFSFTAPGEPLVRVYIQDGDCTDEYESTLQVLPMPRADIVCPLEGCTDTEIAFQSLSEAATPLQHVWSLGNGATSSDASFVYAYPEPGTYTISLIVFTTTGCVATDTLTLPDHLQIHPSPVAGFDMDRNDLNIFDAVLSVTDASLGALAWNYHAGGNTYYSPSFMHTFEESGTQWIHQLVSNEHQCTDTLSRAVNVNGHLIYAPNAFTPGTDGINDGFAPVLTGALAYELVIHDRWGRELFRTADPTMKWNGDGSPQGTYMYTVYVVDHVLRKHVHRGHVTLLR